VFGRGVFFAGEVGANDTALGAGALGLGAGAGGTTGASGGMGGTCGPLIANGNGVVPGF
jgi:hypothetical protein